MEERGLLLDAVSVLRPVISPTDCSPALFSVLTDSVFTTSVADALWAIVTPAYVQLSQEFHVSLDEVASSFAASLPGLAAFTYVAAIVFYPLNVGI